MVSDFMLERHIWLRFFVIAMYCINVNGAHNFAILVINIHAITKIEYVAECSTM